MTSRRSFLKLSAAAGLLGAKDLRARDAAGMPPLNGAGAREFWTRIAARLSAPLLSALAGRRLREVMPVESHPNSRDRREFTYLEGLGRLLAGIAPWLELGVGTSDEARERVRLAELARQGIDAATDPDSPDLMNFSRGRQPLVDAAFLAQAILRAPRELWEKLEPRVRQNLVAAMLATRPIPAGENNWKLFATMVEVFLQRVGEVRDHNRLFEGITRHRDWYVGDGMYGDGPEFRWDYYNSFVIQPMLLESLDVVAGEAEEWQALRGKVVERLTRWAAVQERLIAPDGSYPAVGRSLAYRAGAFQGLALAALRHALPAELLPGQARVALTRVIWRTLAAAENWDGNGWLQIGLSGHQPRLGETYISTGSLYLCSVALLPLGLPPSDPFWSEPPARTTWEKAWSGGDLPADKALRAPPPTATKDH